MYSDSRKKILIVEDDPSLSELFKMFMNDLGYELSGIFQEGKVAIEECRKEQPDVIIMDINIPGELDGIKTAVIIKDTFDIPIIYLSSHTEEDIVKRAVETNCYGYLVKPVDEATMGIAIEQAFYKHKNDRDTKIRETRYKNLLDISPNTIMVLIDDVIEYINKAGLKLFGTNYEQDLIGKPVTNFVALKYQDDFKTKIDLAIKTNISIEPFIVKFKTFQEHYYNVEIIVTLIEYKNKKAAQLIVTDYTEKIKNQAKLVEQDNIIDNLHDGVISLSLSGNIKSWNKGAEKLFGFSKHEIMNKHLSFAFNNQENEMSFQKKFLEPTLDFLKNEVEVSYTHNKTREKKWVHITLTILKNIIDEITGVICYCRDITQHKLSEESLIVSEANLKAIFDVCKDAIFFINNDNKILDSNKLAKEYSRNFFKKDIYSGQSVTEILSFFDTIEINSILSSTIQGVTHYLERAIEVNEKNRYMRITIYPIIHEEVKEISRYCISMQDITENKSIEKELFDLRSELKPIFDSSIQRFYLTDIDYKIITFNKAAEDMIRKEYKHSLKKGDYFPDFISESLSFSEFENMFAKAKNGEVVIHKYSGLVEGTEYWIEVHFEPVLNERGEITRVLIWTLDITNEKKIEDTLKESQNKYFTLFSQANDAILIIHEKSNGHKIIDCNEKAIQLLGYSREELYTTDILKLSPERQTDGTLSVEKRKILIDTTRQGQKPVFEWNYKCKNGNIITVELSLKIIHINNIEYLYAIIRDISERIDMEKKLKELLGKIDQMEKKNHEKKE